MWWRRRKRKIITPPPPHRILRDGAGMISSLLFTSLSSESFGADVKRWRFFADFIVDVGIFAEMAAASFAGSPLFLGLLCFASMCKALCGVSAGAANSAISVHFASAGA